MARILSVDDSKSIRDLITHILAQHNHEVITAADGLEAMRVARENDAVDLALIDVNMPNMSGVSLVSKLRRLDEYKYIPIIMVTTETDGYKKQKAKSVGATGWLSKPFTEERLLAAVEKTLR